LQATSLSATCVWFGGDSDLLCRDSGGNTGRWFVRLFKWHHDGMETASRGDFIYVDGTVAVMQCFLDHPRVNGISNVGTGVASSFKEMITALFAALGRGPNIEYIDMPPTIRNSYEHLTQANTDHLNQAGYSPRSRRSRRW
jgi:ADP-L-glycero-D-manno-heptose 6-epimerase